MKLAKYLTTAMIVGASLSGCNEQKQIPTQEKYHSQEKIYDIPQVTVKAERLPKEAQYLSGIEFEDMINKIYNSTPKDPIITKDFYKTVVKKESSLNVNAFNRRSKARGLGQILRETWEDMDTTSYDKNAFNPEKNLEVTLKYLSWIPNALEKMHPEWHQLSHEEKLDQVIASYNWGIGRLRKNNWDFEKSPKETKDYRTFVHSQLNIRPQ